MTQENNTANGKNPAVEIIRLTLVLFMCYWPFQVNMWYIRSPSSPLRQRWQCLSVIKGKN